MRPPIPAFVVSLGLIVVASGGIHGIDRPGDPEAHLSLEKCDEETRTEWSAFEVRCATYRGSFCDAVTSVISTRGGLAHGALLVERWNVERRDENAKVALLGFVEAKRPVAVFVHERSQQIVIASGRHPAEVDGGCDWRGMIPSMHPIASIDCPTEQQLLVSSESSTPPVVASRLTVDWPEEVRSGALTGSMTLQLWVRHDGSVGNARVIRSSEPNRELEDLVLEAAQQLQFHPGETLCVPTGSLVSYNVRYGH